MTHITWKNIYNNVIQHKKKLFLGTLIVLIAEAILAPVPMFLPFIADEVFLNEDHGIKSFIEKIIGGVDNQTLLIIAISLTIILRSIGVFFLFISTKIFNIVSKTITHKIREKMLDESKQTMIKEFETKGSGAISSKFVTDVNTIEGFIDDTIALVLKESLVIILIGTIIFILSPWLAAFIIVFGPIAMLATKTFRNTIKKWTGKYNAAIEDFQDSTVEYLDYAQQLRVDHKEEWAIAKLKEKSNQLKEIDIEKSWRTSLINEIINTIFSIGMAIFYFVGFSLILYGEGSIGTVLAMVPYFFMFAGSLSKFSQIQLQFYNAEKALERINEYINLDKEDDFNTEKQIATKKKITFNNVNFGYSKEKQILYNTNLTIEPNKVTAVVGKTGSGKSTLIQLLFGLHNTWNGDIKIGDDSIYDIGFNQVREKIGAVLQNPVLFNTSIRENLLYGADIPDKKLWEVLNIVQLDDTVKSLPDGLDTLVGKGGIRMSGGQKQRLSIARTILLNPEIIVFDEATSALDNETEFLMHQKILKEFKDRTTLIIAHREATIINADIIHVMKHGQVVETGTYNELMNQKGEFFNIYRKK